MAVNLLNGCSYGKQWLTFDGVNLSQLGNSMHGIIRTTMEWVAVNGKPDAVLVPITFMHRYEFAFDLADDKPIYGPYRNINSDETLRDDWQRLICRLNSEYDVYDKLLVSLIGFTGWLESQNINYLMWNQCNRFSEWNYDEFQACEKRKWVLDNPNIIDLYSFCGNQYMYDCGATHITETVFHDDPRINHYDTEYYDEYLLPYLRSYIKENNLNLEL